MLRVKLCIIVAIILGAAVANATFLPKLLYLYSNSTGTAPPPVETTLELLNTLEMLDTVELL